MSKSYYLKLKTLNTLLQFKEVKNSMKIAELKDLRNKIKNKKLTIEEINMLIKKFNKIIG